MRVIGLMSGTSADGIDACLAQIEQRDGRLAARTEHFRTVPYADDVRRRVLDCRTAADVCRLNVELGEAFAAAAIRLCDDAGVPLPDVATIGSHGQTICHLPGDGATLQIGEPCVIAERTGITTVADFRMRDVAAGGSGAPLVPMVDHLLLADPKTDRVALNIGGIANVTVLPAGGTLEQVLAFDTGPGNMIIDGVIESMTQGRETCDRGGELAARGKPHAGMIERMLEHPYFHAPPPKSTGREQFGADYVVELVGRARSLGLSDADTVATATALTTRTIAGAIRRWAFNGPSEIVASGGGVHNLTLMTMLREQLPTAQVVTSDAHGIDPDAKEALAFAALACLTLEGRPGNVPGATGARRPVVLGKIVPGRRTELHHGSAFAEATADK